MLSFYHQYLSPIYHAFGKIIFGPSFACRFSPSCSVYTQQALRRYGIIQGTKLSVIRLLKCNPISKGGHDPIPDKIK